MNWLLTIAVVAVVAVVGLALLLGAYVVLFVEEE